MPRVLPVFLALVLVFSAGCVRLATEPIRDQREQQAQAAFARLAALTPEQIAGFIDDRMTLRLELAPPQRDPVAAINLKYARQLQRTAAGANSVREKVSAIRAQESAKDADLHPVLTPSQFSRYQAMKQDLRAALREWVAGRKSNQPPP